MKKQLEEIPNQTLEQLSVLFVKYGYRSLSMLDIATELAISKKTLYQYVSNKEDLILNVFQFQTKPIEEEIQTIIQEEISFKEKIQKMVACCVQFYQIVHYKSALDADKFYPKVYQEHQVFQKEVLHTSVYKITKQAKHQKIVKAKINCKIATGFFLQLVKSVFYTSNFISAENQQVKINQIVNYHLFAILN